MDDDYTQEELDLLNCIARSEGLHNHSLKPKTNYTPLLKHPLPMSDRRYEHENVLRRVLSCKPSFQGMAAISQGDAWTLEEVYMRGGPIVLSPKNGNHPIHLAVQVQSVDCVMVLINMKVNLNAVNSLGYTPLFLAQASGGKEITKLLEKNHAQLYIDVDAHIPRSQSVLDVYPEASTYPTKSGKPPVTEDKNYLQKFLSLPDSSNNF
ncbi:ankyrin repeat domain-containing protein [archaeon]|nr:MAG: ankyrin repeat domain-containing protein [archaeon]